MESTHTDCIASAEAGVSGSRFNRLAAYVVGFCLVLSAALVSFAPLRSGSSWMVYEEDDFFYYLKVAANFAHGQGSTFNGIVPTNGYHPLWFLLLTFFTRISSPATLPVLLYSCLFVATVATYLFADRLLRLQTANRLLTASLSAYVALYSLHVFLTGMEVILTIPLTLGMMLAYQSRSFWQPRIMPALGLGLLLSAIFLSRLDTCLFIVLGILLTGCHPGLRKRLSRQQVLGVALGLVPCFVYVLVNHHYFHTWVTVSAMAKQLKPTLHPTSELWITLFNKTPKGLLNLVIIVVSIQFLAPAYRRLTDTQQVLYPLLLLFPFLYFSILCCISDWIIWDWYLYCLRIALCISFAVFLTWRPTARLLSRTWITVPIAIAMLALLAMNRRPSLKTGIDAPYAAAVDIREFAKSHPGTYAMGDRAGVVGYLLPESVVQLEGLMMDRDYLNLVRRSTPLQQVFDRYNARYYVGTSLGPYTGCFHAIEPVQAGPGSPHMFADLCQSPLATFTHNHWTTLIFAVDTSGSLSQPAR